MIIFTSNFNKEQLMFLLKNKNIISNINEKNLKQKKENFLKWEEENINNIDALFKKNKKFYRPISYSVISVKDDYNLKKRIYYVGVLEEIYYGKMNNEINYEKETVYNHYLHYLDNEKYNDIYKNQMINMINISKIKSNYENEISSNYYNLMCSYIIFENIYDIKSYLKCIKLLDDLLFFKEIYQYKNVNKEKFIDIENKQIVIFLKQSNYKIISWIEIENILEKYKDLLNIFIFPYENKHEIKSIVDISFKDRT